jgi:CD2 antigen cytoplasmic tail-binding protein 2
VLNPLLLHPQLLEPAEDPANFAEQVDSALEDPQANRKGRVKNEGYDSDSSDDGEGVVNSRKKDEEEEEEDMFNIKDESEKAADSGSKKKDKSYMRLGDIEGQEFEESGSENSGSDSDEEPEDEDAEERRKKKGMGFELSSFNMRDEMDEGKFTDDGAYIRSFDAHAVHDKWMEDVDERAIRKARKRKKEQDRVQKQRIIAEERELEQTGGKPALEIALLSRLRRGESVLEALQRLGKLRQARYDLYSTVPSAYTHPDPFLSQTKALNQRHVCGCSLRLLIETYSCIRH